MAKPNKLTREVDAELKRRGHDWTGNKKMMKSMFELEDKNKHEKIKNDLNLISKIVKRGFSTMHECYSSAVDMFMDIEYAHRDCPLNLQKWLEADDANFYHDTYGIYENLNRKTKKLENCFVPRFAK